VTKSHVYHSIDEKIRNANLSCDRHSTSLHECFSCSPQANAGRSKLSNCQEWIENSVSCMAARAIGKYPRRKLPMDFDDYRAKRLHISFTADYSTLFVITVSNE